MGKTVTFSVGLRSEGVIVEESFNLKDLEIDEHLNEDEMIEEVEKVFRKWVRKNIASSYRIDS